MKHISMSLSEEIKKVLPNTLEKDLQDNEAICPTCHGLGVIAVHNKYGIKGDTSEIAKREHFPYDHQSVWLCPNCYNGVIKLCEYCGKPFRKGSLQCNCEQVKERRREAEAKKYNEIILKAKEIPESSVETMLYCEENDEYYDSTDDFLEAYYEDEFGTRPEILWVCSESSISLDAYDIVSTACEELHEDAAENCEIKELQGILDNWCKEQTGAITYYPNYHEYVRINWDDYK